jgi:hypothetical protein
LAAKNFQPKNGSYEAFLDQISRTFAESPIRYTLPSAKLLAPGG